MQPNQGPANIHLSEGQALPESATPMPAAPGEPLSDAEIQAILRRLSPLPASPTGQAEFRLALDPIPPPRSGETVQQPFPPSASASQPGTVPAGPLEVLRYAPQGEVEIAPFVSVTFNQPMVPVGTLADLSEEEVPAHLEPAVPGTWRWVGTRTLTFQYDSQLIDRLPMATEFRVTIPAGTQSATGGLLGEAVTWTFTTPPPQVETTYPLDLPQPLEPLFFIAFDQQIDPAAVLKTIQVRANNQPINLRLADEAEIQVDQAVSRLVERSAEGRWLAFRATQPLPADAGIFVAIGPGTPSLEGPQITQNSQSYSFRTYAPLKVMEHGCNWSDDPCQPLAPLFIRFNNVLDQDGFSEDLLVINPELPGASINLYGDTIQISGQTQGRTTYTVRVSANLKDSFGQQLGKDAELAFKVGAAEPRLAGPGKTFLTLDPSAQKPVFPVYVINLTRLNVKIYSVQPSNWPAFKNYQAETMRTDQPLIPPGSLVYDKTIAIESAEDALTEVGIDLTPALQGSGSKPYGHFIVIVEPPRNLFTRNQEWRWRKVQAWVQISQIGLDAFTDQREMIAWATNLKDGRPLANVAIQPESSSRVSLTDADGLARFNIPNGATYLVASLGADQAMLPRSVNLWDEDAWQTQPVDDFIRWYVMDDRQMYRPGEELHIKGWLRRVGGQQDGDVGLVGQAVEQIEYQVMDPQGNELGGGRAQVNGLGGFDFSYTIPQKTNLGTAYLSLVAQGNLSGLQGTEYSYSFQIQEFRRPEFEVLTRSETSGPYFAGEHAVVAVEAKYYAGDPLPNAVVNWQVTTSPASYAPPNWPDFVFGTWTPWWLKSRSYFESFPGDWQPEGKVETFTGQTDASGVHLLRLDFERGGEPEPVSVIAQATVNDVNRQAWANSTTLLVHPANVYVGLRSQRLFVEYGQPLQVDLIVTDLDGNPLADRSIDVRAARLEWKYKGGEWQEVETDIQQCEQVSSSEPVSCTFTPPSGGTYRITAQVKDDQGRLNQSQITRWVSGGQRPPSRSVEQEEITLIPNQESYQPGENAQILVQPPFTPAEGLLTVSRSGILYTQRFRIEQGTITLQVPILEEHIPNLNIQVDLVGAAVRTNERGEALPDAPLRPAFASGSLTLKIPPLQRTLSVQAIPQQPELEPGGETTVDLKVLDQSGRPVAGAEVALVVVDEAILALSNYQLTDPLSIFYAERSSDVVGIYGRASVLLAGAPLLEQGATDQAQGGNTLYLESALPAAEAPAEEMKMMRSAAAVFLTDAAQPAIQVRSDFNPLALFSPTVLTDANGVAQVPIKLPDNLTRYRVMAVAVDPGGRQFGMAESSLVARLPLMVRPSAPRFLNFGDQFELPVVLQNQMDVALVVDVVVQATNLELPGPAGLRVTVPAHDRLEVRFPAATQMAGTTSIRVAAVSGGYSDAATLELPVYTPATSEAFAVYGVVDEGAVIQPVLPPEGVFSQYGGLEINTSSTALQALTDAVLYLVAYPFECTEQLASRILAVAGLRDVLDAFEADGLPDPQELQAAVARDITRLQGLQNQDGGFPYWQRGRDSIPFNSIHVAHALQRARQKGFEVPQEMQANVRDHLRNIEQYYPAWYSQRTRQTLSAYALYVRKLMGDPDPDKALRLVKEAGVEGLTLDALGWLWPVLQDVPGADTTLQAMRRHINNQVVETAGAANFITGVDDQTYLLLSSNRRTDAILLEALIGDNPEHDLIPKLVNGLLAHRERGRWANTQENVFVLLALDRYFNTFEAQAPDFVARLWLGEAYAGEYEFRGRTTQRQETVIPMSYLVEQSPTSTGSQNLVLSKEGDGRLYYRLGLRYAPLDLELDSLDMGFVVQRRYEALDDREDVFQDEQGVWQIKAGARVRVRLVMVADNRRYHVALVDPLPAGLEIVNPALAVSENIPQDPGISEFRYGWWWQGAWYDHQNLRDERAEAFTPLLWDGVYEYSYITRATTPGRYVVPPARAEEMYSPEVFGRSSSDIVVVK